MSKKVQVQSKTEALPVGSLVIDCTSLAPFIEDLAPRERLGMRTTHAGYAEVVAEISANQPTLGSEVGIVESDIQAIATADERIALIDTRLSAARKLVELLEETRAKFDDERQRRVFEIAALVDVRSKGRRDTKLHAAYQKTRAYRSAIALKAVKTRRKNAEATSTPATSPHLEA